VTIVRDDAEERAARIDAMLKELSLTFDDLTELAKQTVQQSRLTAVESHRLIAIGRRTR
jgi:hypothetical protein